MSHLPSPQAMQKAQLKLLRQLDRLVNAGRITTQEAERLRSAGTDQEFEDQLRYIRRRHVRGQVRAAASRGLLSQTEADDLLQSFERTGDPHLLSDLRRRLQRLRRTPTRRPGNSTDNGNRDD